MTRVETKNTRPCSAQKTLSPAQAGTAIAKNARKPNPDDLPLATQPRKRGAGTLVALAFLGALLLFPKDSKNLPVIDTQMFNASVARVESLRFDEKDRTCIPNQSSETCFFEAGLLGLKIVEDSRKFIGIPYKWAGRLPEDKAVDCIGLVFCAHGGLVDKPWDEYSVMPSTLMPQLGEPVPGSASTRTANATWSGKKAEMLVRLAPREITDGIVDYSNLMPGDLVFFLKPKKTRDAAVAKIGGRKQWVWHAAIYNGEQGIVHAESRFTHSVLEETLDSFFQKYPATTGFIAVRPRE